MSHTAGNTIPVLAPSAPRNEPGVETMQTGNAVLSQDERFIQYLRDQTIYLINAGKASEAAPLVQRLYASRSERQQSANDALADIQQEIDRYSQQRLRQGDVVSSGAAIELLENTAEVQHTFQRAKTQICAQCEKDALDCLETGNWEAAEGPITLGLQNSSDQTDADQLRIVKAFAFVRRDQTREAEKLLRLAKTKQPQYPPVFRCLYKIVAAEIAFFQRQDINAAYELCREAFQFRAALDAGFPNLALDASYLMARILDLRKDTVQSGFYWSQLPSEGDFQAARVDHRWTRRLAPFSVCLRRGRALGLGLGSLDGFVKDALDRLDREALQIVDYDFSERRAVYANPRQPSVQTPLTYYAENGMKEQIHLLISELGVDINGPFEYGLFFAVVAVQYPTAKYLLKAGASPNTITTVYHNDTPFLNLISLASIAPSSDVIDKPAFKTRLKLLRTMIAHGADPTIRNTYGRNACDIVTYQAQARSPLNFSKNETLHLGCLLDLCKTISRAKPPSGTGRLPFKDLKILIWRKQWAIRLHQVLVHIKGAPDCITIPYMILNLSLTLMVAITVQESSNVVLCPAIVFFVMTILSLVWLGWNHTSKVQLKRLRLFPGATINDTGLFRLLTSLITLLFSVLLIPPLANPLKYIALGNGEYTAIWVKLDMKNLDQMAPPTLWSLYFKSPIPYIGSMLIVITGMIMWFLLSGSIVAQIMKDRIGDRLEVRKLLKNTIYGLIKELGHELKTAIGIRP